uniref:Uncharacterized protein n=1 Tax=Magallana gigas TaxID=29159 RepID=A0A8W8MMH5_MAGGI
MPPMSDTSSVQPSLNQICRRPVDRTTHNFNTNFVKDEDINEYSPIFDEFTTEWIGDQEFSVASFNEGDFMGKEGTNRKRKLEVDFSCEGQSQTKKPRFSEENLILSTFSYIEICVCENTKTSAKQELAERTEAPKDVAVVSEKDGKRERKMTSKMEESTKDVTRSAVKPAKKGNLQTNGKRKKSSKKELPSASCLESVETLPDKSKKKKSKDASIKKATEKNKKDISHVAEILMSSLMEEEDSNNSSSLKSGSQSTGDPKLASQLSLTSSRSSPNNIHLHLGHHLSRQVHRFIPRRVVISPQVPYQERLL